MPMAAPLERAANWFISAYRRTGADVPFGDPLPSHGTEMEGWFWRVTDAATGRVVVALCSANRHPDGDWSTVAVALHPGGVVRSAALSGAVAERSRFEVTAGTADDLFAATKDRLRMRIGDVDLDMKFDDKRLWPKVFGGGGVFSSVPFLNQYWHPYRLGGTAGGTVTFGETRWDFDDAVVYCERNWGAGFPQRWWWGEAHDFGGQDAVVAFSGGLLELGPLRRDVTGVVVRLGDRVIRLTPPTPVHGESDGQDWYVRARSWRYQIELRGSGTHDGPHVLPVPMPSQRRNIDTDFEYLAGGLTCTVREFGRVIFEGTSDMAGLEIGTRPS